MSAQKVIYWHRLGLKVYDISKKSSPNLEKEIESNDIEQIKSELSYISNQEVLLLLADEISYLYEKTIDPPLVVDDNFKYKLLEIIKSEIPEDFSEFNWDYKIEETEDKSQKVKIFAPVSEFQLLIKEVSNSLGIKIEAIESESVASTRDPNPIVGIIKKNDINAKDEDCLNISINPQKVKKPISLKKIVIMTIIIAIISSTTFILKDKNPITNFSKIIPVKNQPTATPTPILDSTIIESTTKPEIIKDWAQLNMMVQNGTSQNGLASKTATIFKTAGISQVATGNADKDTYALNELIFKSSSLKENYQSKFKTLITVTDSNIKIDNSINYDVIFIKGLN
ncbi:MAG: LytR C-terminal domain-containing protein [Candidatus Shapirobacteria bacterium]